jgi:3-hydroxymyristoyl/3-hydroxydecanoyl-(acyl carrier protein) dehydratase
MNSWIPEIIARSEEGAGRLRLTLAIRPDLTYFSGHFPGLPLLPGVVQVDWAARFGREYLQASGEFLSLDNLKFQAVIFPGATLELELEWQPASGRLVFAYSQNGQPMSSGRLSFRTQGAA